MSLDKFFEDEDSLYNPTIDTETRNRIKLCIAAYAYECMNTSIMSDAEFDKLAYSIDLKVKTRRPDLDAWFQANFKPHTGMWINNHPDKAILRSIVTQILSRKQQNEFSKDHCNYQPSN